MGIDKNMDRKEIQVALAEVLPTIKDAVGGKKTAFAQVITESIEPNRLTMDALQMFGMPVRQLNVGDRLEKKVRRIGFPVRTMVPGSTHLSDPIYPPRDIMTYNLDTIIAKMRQSVWELQNGELGTVETFRNEMASALVDEIISRTFNLVASVWNGTTSKTNYVDATSTGLTTTIADNMIETVSYRAGSVRTIIGSRSALLPLYKANAIVEVTDSNGDPVVIGVQSMLEEWRRTGKLGLYRGIPIVELPQIYKRTADGFDTPLLPMDKVVFLGDRTGDIILYGGTETQENTDYNTEPAEYSLAMWRSYGLMVDYPENIGVVKVNDPSYSYIVP